LSVTDKGTPGAILGRKAVAFTIFDSQVVAKILKDVWPPK
jgi:hypothetical protein